jgi:iron complex outermembrane receptor protein
LRKCGFCLCLVTLAAGVCPAQVTRHEEVVVTGTPDPIPLEEIDRPVTVLPVAGQADLAGALTDFLRLDPAVDVRGRAPAGVQTDISIRGGSFGQTLVLLNGQRMNDVQTGHFNMDLPLPLEAVERIEVLHGTSSTLYGSDAVGGVINVITRRPEATSIRLGGAAGNFGVNEQRVSVGTSFGRFAEQLAVSRDFSSGFMPDRDYRNLAAFSGTYWTSALGASSLMLGYSDKPYGADQFYGYPNSWEDTKTWLLSFQQNLGSRTQAGFSFRRHSDWFLLARDRPELYANHHSDRSFEASVRRTEPVAANTSLHYGLEGYGDSMESTNLGAHDRGRGAAYLSLDARALRRFSLSAGLREEVYKWGRGELSPSVAVGTWLSESLKLRASASRAFRIPTYTDLYYHDPVNLGSPDLKPETAWSYEGGAEWTRWGFCRLSATVFHRRETNVIDYVRSSTDEPWRAMNISRLRFTGLEASAILVPAKRQQITVSYEALAGAREALGPLLSKYVFNYPSHSGVVAWQGSYGAWLWRARLGAVNRLARAPYAVLDVSAGYTRGRIHPFLRLANLGDTRYEEVAGVVMPGRAIVGGINLVLR